MSIELQVKVATLEARVEAMSRRLAVLEAVVTEPVEDERDALVAAYVAKHGRRPHPNTSLEKLRA